MTREGIDKALRMTKNYFGLAMIDAIELKAYDIYANLYTSYHDYLTHPDPESRFHEYQILRRYRQILRSIRRKQRMAS